MLRNEREMKHALIDSSYFDDNMMSADSLNNVERLQNKNKMLDMSLSQALGVEMESSFIIENDRSFHSNVSDDSMDEDVLLKEIINTSNDKDMHYLFDDEDTAADRYNFASNPVVEESNDDNNDIDDSVEGSVDDNKSFSDSSYDPVNTDGDKPETLVGPQIALNKVKASEDQESNSTLLWKFEQMQKQLNIFKHRGNPIVFFAN